nr:hypothetical protein [Lentzea guizhouensis]
MDDLLDIAAALLPGVNLDRAFRATEGNIHHVLLVPGVAAVRVSRRASGAAAMPRRVEVLRRLASAGLPFQVPEPLTPVTMFGERAAVAVSWVGGTALPKGAGAPEQIAEVLEAVRSVPLDGELLEAVDHRDEGPHWAETISTVIIPRLPVRWQAEVRRCGGASTRPWSWSPCRTRWCTATSAAATCTGPRTGSWSASSTGTTPCPATPRSTRR